MADDRKAEDGTLDDLLRTARDRYDESESSARINRDNARDDIRFARLGEQWPADVAKTRAQESRPMLTINRLPSFIRQVVNDARLNKPGILVKPVDNGADVPTAQVIQGLIRSIERNSEAEVAYDTAIDNAVSAGFGFFQIGIEHVSGQSFAMQCTIDRIANPLSVHWDTMSTKFDASDWRYAFVDETMPRDEFARAYPDKAPVDFQGDTRDTATGNDSGNTTSDDVHLVWYWSREEEPDRLYELEVIADPMQRRTATRSQLLGIAGGMVEEIRTALGAEFTQEDIDGVSDDSIIDEIVEGLLMASGERIVRSRGTVKFTVSRRLLSGADVLEHEPWPGTMIPICPVWGEEVFSDGRRVFRSMIRDARDPQAMFNFWRTAGTELVALAPRAPWLVEEGAIPEGHEEAWRTANTRSHPFLAYKRGFNMPQRQPFASVPGGALQESLNAADDLKATTGIFDPALGARSNETSGVAISARQRESDVSNFHFVDNLNRAIAYAGRVLVEVIPHVYTEQQTVRILGVDDVEKVVILKQQGQMVPNPGQVGADDDTLYDLSVGQYDVSIESGPTFATQREETRDTLIEIMRQVPGAGEVIGDKVVEHLDFVGADEIAERLRMLFQARYGIGLGGAPQGAAGIPGPGQVAGQPVGAGPQPPLGSGGVPLDGVIPNV